MPFVIINLYNNINFIVLVNLNKLKKLKLKLKNVSSKKNKSFRTLCHIYNPDCFYLGLNCKFQSKLLRVSEPERSKWKFMGICVECRNKFHFKRLQ